MKTDKKKLRLWQERLGQQQAAYEDEIAKMDRREEIYRGSPLLRTLVPGDYKKNSPHVRNIAAELIEAQVNSSIPQPKVTACRKGDELKAKLIEDMLRNELDRMPFEQLNDRMERIVPIQGGGFFLVEWDNNKGSHSSIGDVTVSILHPKQVLPQEGVYTAVEDMDYIILKLPQTKEFLRRRYGVDLENEAEAEPEIKSAGGEGPVDDMVTQYVAYYRNEDGGIGLYSWVNDTQLEDMDDYQARRLRRCTKCGMLLHSSVEPLGIPSLDGNFPFGQDWDSFLEGKDGEKPTPKEKEVCPYCGSTSFRDSVEEYEEVNLPGLGLEVFVRVPFYKPDIYPLLMQRNVTVFGQFLGDSDIDKIADQQNTTNRIEAKIIDKLVKSGSYMTLPDAASVRADAEDMKIIRPGSPADKALIDVYTIQGDISQDMAYLEQVYEEARQVIGITDSFQGRKDTTATSGKAKEFAAAQSAGRLESKRVMKDAAYAALFEAIFKFKLAYADEPRPVVATDDHGNPVYEEFNRYDFLEQDAAGEWYWNDQFLFSCDTSAPLAANREAMWQETRMNFETGAFGDPTALSTLILFWGKMEMLHYPGAAETKRYLEEERNAQQQQAMLQQQAMMQQAMQQGGSQSSRMLSGGQEEFGGIEQMAMARAGQDVLQAIDEQARADAFAAVQSGNVSESPLGGMGNY